MRSNWSEKISRALDRFTVELPSWGFANTGTRFGKYLQPAAGSTIEEKLSDAGQVQALTGAGPGGSSARSVGLPEGLGGRARGCIGG